MSDIESVAKKYKKEIDIEVDYLLQIEKHLEKIDQLKAKLKQRDEMCRKEKLRADFYEDAFKKLEVANKSLGNLLREACEFLDSDVFERRFQYKYRMLEEDPLVCPKEQFLNKPEIKQIMEEDNE